MERAACISETLFKPGRESDVAGAAISQAIRDEAKKMESGG
jgi:hypothetical protein